MDNSGADLIADGPVGSPERRAHDRILFERLAAGQEPTGRDQLAERFLPLARQLARRYATAGESYDDLVQVASVGLIKAIDRFDPARGTAFSSFAVPTILGEIKRHFRDKGWAVRVPRELQERAMKVEKAGELLSTQLGRAPTVEETAEHLQLSNEDVIEARSAASAHRSLSIDKPVNTDSGSEESMTVVDTLGVEDREFGRVETSVTLQVLFDSLSPREREVVILRFQEDLTQAEIGERVGVSQMHVSRLLRQAISRLRSAAEPAPVPVNKKATRRSD